MYFLEIFIFILQHILDSVRRDEFIDFLDVYVCVFFL